MIDITHVPNLHGLNFQDEGNCKYVIKRLTKDLITFNAGSVTTAQLTVVGEIASVHYKFPSNAGSMTSATGRTSK